VGKKGVCVKNKKNNSDVRRKWKVEKSKTDKPTSTTNGQRKGVLTARTPRIGKRTRSIPRERDQVVCPQRGLGCSENTVNHATTTRKKVM